MNQYADQHMGLRIPVLSGLDSLLGSGLWLSVADRDVVWTAPAAPRKETYKMAVGGDPKSAPRATRNSAAFLDLFEWMFRDWSGGEESVVSSAQVPCVSLSGMQSNVDFAGVVAASLKIALARYVSPWILRLA